MKIEIGIERSRSNLFKVTINGEPVGNGFATEEMAKVVAKWSWEAINPIGSAVVSALLSDDLTVVKPEESEAESLRSRIQKQRKGTNSMLGLGLTGGAALAVQLFGPIFKELIAGLGAEDQLRINRVIARVSGIFDKLDPVIRAAVAAELQAEMEAAAADPVRRAYMEIVKARLKLLQAEDQADQVDQADQAEKVAEREARADESLVGTVDRAPADPPG